MHFTTLLVKLTVPLKVSVSLVSAQIAPPKSAELLMKLLVPLKLTTVLPGVVKIAPPSAMSAELLMKALFPLKVSTELLNA